MTDSVDVGSTISPGDTGHAPPRLHIPTTDIHHAANFAVTTCRRDNCSALWSVCISSCRDILLPDCSLHSEMKHARGSGTLDVLFFFQAGMLKKIIIIIIKSFFWHLKVYKCSSRTAKVKREQFFFQCILKESQLKDPYHPDFPIPSQAPGRLLHLEISPLKQRVANSVVGLQWLWKEKQKPDYFFPICCMDRETLTYEATIQAP